jgi:cyclopropane fatty-acyl-phospholipid synthase-like methyltransferase
LSDITDYWNTRILSWEDKRYGLKSVRRNSLQCRQAQALDFLLTLPKNSRVVEFGCGSGLLLEKRLEQSLDSEQRNTGFPFEKYVGIDVSPVAIERFRERLRTGPFLKFRLEERVSLICSSVEQTDFSGLDDADTVLSTGLIDWLNESELETLAAFSGRRRYFHTFSAKSPNPLRWIHVLYMQLLRRYYQTSLVSKYHAESEIVRLFAGPEPDAPIVRSFPGGSFGRIIESGVVDKAKLLDHFSRIAPDYRDRLSRFPWAVLRKIEVLAYRSWLRDSQASRVLNVGAGTEGILNDILPSAKIDTIDISPEMIGSARISGRSICGDFETHDFGKDKFDLVVLIGVLEFFENTRAALEKSRKLLSESGEMVVFAPLCGRLSGLYRNHHRSRGISIRLFKLDGFKTMLTSAGFEILETRVLPGWSVAVRCRLGQ